MMCVRVVTFALQSCRLRRPVFACILASPKRARRFVYCISPCVAGHRAEQTGFTSPFHGGSTSPEGCIASFGRDTIGCPVDFRAHPLVADNRFNPSHVLLFSFFAWTIRCYRVWCLVLSLRYSGGEPGTAFSAPVRQVVGLLGFFRRASRSSSADRPHFLLVSCRVAAASK